MLCLGSLVLCCFAIPIIIPIVLILIYIFVRLRTYFCKIWTGIEALERASQRAPFSSRLTNVAKSLNGPAYGYAEVSQSNFLKRLDINGRAWFSWLLANRWVGFNLDVISFVVLASVVIVGCVLSPYLDIGLVALSIVYVIQLSAVSQYMVRLSAVVESQMTCGAAFALHHPLNLRKKLARRQEN